MVHAPLAHVPDQEYIIFEAGFQKLGRAKRLQADHCLFPVPMSH